ncbi:hypothetical protein BS50DRAFT_573563 [Corynespora cassiicola Philippines]|uniref:Uncharacterized protein n=1 Tax=Corynespora cassiicola Philippines TaxID=1448308 RepID=A0A2T2NMT7_CORCC|nr:hypothetical protein BS50DRAFT_573563 [Corynespora cassiicola Philippines]
MCAAHVCVRSALTQAFRPSHCRLSAPASVLEFLVPALYHPSRRPFSSTKRRRAQAHSPFHSSIEPPEDRVTISHLSKTPRKDGRVLQSVRGALPEPDARGDIRQWAHTLDHLLPPHLRRNAEDSDDISALVTPLDVSYAINAAQDASHDILGYIGLVEQRWDAVIWLVKRLTGKGRQSYEYLPQLDPFANIIWPEERPRSLDNLTNGPLLLKPTRPPTPLQLKLDELTAAPDSVDPNRSLVKRALGQVWRTLGSMILTATEEHPEEGSIIMPHVLEIIAHLHHVGLIPDSIYTQQPAPADFALRQPPTLHLLSSKILTALSDASWRAHEASVKAANDQKKAKYFLGHEIPGSRYKVMVSEVAPELWLELVLWSCLHGGWTLDGTFVLEKIASYRGGHHWGLISWNELTEAQEEESSASSQGWGIFRSLGAATPETDDRSRTRKTISSEIVTAFIDGLVNLMRLGVGHRGTEPEALVEHIKKLKQFLDENSLSLGSTTWDSIMVRLLETGGIVSEKRPELLLRILELASGFGTEVSAANTSPATANGSDLPYFFEPSTVPISLLHRAMQFFINNGGLSGALTSLKLLQQYTDENKQRSLQQFFENLKSAPRRPNEPFSSSVPAIHFPAFDPQLSVPLLANLLDLVTEAELKEVGDWLLFSKDLDGPLIKPHMYASWSMGASLIRYGTMSGNNELVLKIVNEATVWNEEQQAHRMSAELFTALFTSQVRLRRWDSVQGMWNYVLGHFGYRPRPEIVASFVAELLRLSKGASEDDMAARATAQESFEKFLFAWEDLILTSIRNELYCILAMASTVDAEWREFCSQFLAFSSRQAIKLCTAEFNKLLGGVLDGYGSVQGKKLVEQWCYGPPTTFESYVAPGGLPRMPWYREGRAQEYERKPDDIEIVQASGAKLILHGRVYPNRQTVWAILRKVQQEQEGRGGGALSQEKDAEVSETLKWATKLLYYLGFDYEDIVRDLGSLAELANLEAPPAPSVLGLPNIEQDP